MVGVVVAAALIGLVVWLELVAGDAPSDSADSVVVPIEQDESVAGSSKGDSGHGPAEAGHADSTADHAATEAESHGTSTPSDHEAAHADGTEAADGKAKPSDDAAGHAEPAHAEGGHDAKDEAPADDHAEPTGDGTEPETTGDAAAHAEGEGDAHGTAAVALAPVDPALLQTSSRGGLPIVGPDGRKPWQVYARPPSHDEKRPRLAIVIGGLGLNRAMTEAAIKLAPEITLSFSPYAAELESLVATARAAGHEVLIDLPLEPISYPADDPGPETLLTTLTPPQNIERLETVMSRAKGYVGLLGVMGSRFTTAPDSLRPVLSVLSERGLLFVDDRSSADSLVGEIASQVKLPHALSAGFVDVEATRSAIDAVLARLEREARPDQPRLVIARPFPVTLQRIEAWSATLGERGILLEPASAVVVTGKKAAKKKASKEASSDDAHGASKESESDAEASSHDKAGDHGEKAGHGDTPAPDDHH